MINIKNKWCKNQMRIEKYKSDNIHIVLTVHIMNDSFVKQFVDSKTCTKK